MTRRLTARTTAGIAVWAATGALVLATAVPASAAEGVLLLSGRALEDPSGCFDVYGYEEILNLTDDNVFVFDDRECEGDLVQMIRPGGEGDDLTRHRGRSAFVA